MLFGILVVLLAHFEVQAGPTTNDGDFNAPSNTKIYRRVRDNVPLDTEFRCPGGWVLGFRTCYKSFAPTMGRNNYKMVQNECAKIGAVPAAMRNAAEEIAVQKSLKLFRNSTNTNDLIILGVVSNHTTDVKQKKLVDSRPFWFGHTDLDGEHIKYRYNKFVPRKTPSSVLALSMVQNGTNQSDDSSKLQCSTYNASSMLMNEINCDCITHLCRNPHIITAITCSKYAEFNGLSTETFFNETSKFQGLKGHKRTYICEDADWTAVLNYGQSDYTNVGFEGSCMKAFKASDVTYHSSEELCGQYDARPATPISDKEVDIAKDLLWSVFPGGYKKSLYVGMRLLERLATFEELNKTNQTNRMNEYINDWDAKPWNYMESPTKKMPKKSAVFYVPTGLVSGNRTFEEAEYMTYNDERNKKFCVIWDLNFGYRSWFCDPKEQPKESSTYPIEAVLCSKLARVKFVAKS